MINPWLHNQARLTGRLVGYGPIPFRKQHFKVILKVTKYISSRQCFLIIAHLIKTVTVVCKRHKSQRTTPSYGDQWSYLQAARGSKLYAGGWTTLALLAVCLTDKLITLVFVILHSSILTYLYKEHQTKTNHLKVMIL